METAAHWNTPSVVTTRTLAMSFHGNSPEADGVQSGADGIGGFEEPAGLKRPPRGPQTRRAAPPLLAFGPQDVM